MSRPRLRLSLNDLQHVVDAALSDDKAARALKSEIRRVLGPAVITDGSLAEAAANANDRIDVLARTGRGDNLSFVAEVVSQFIGHADPEVRKFAARVVPQQYLGKMADDRNSAVRAAVAMRVPTQVVREMMKRFKHDDQLRAIYKQKKLHEAGIAKPEVEPMGHDPAEDAERMGDAAKTDKDSELSDAWYDQQALRFMHDYARGIDATWDDLAVRRFTSSVKATSGVEVDGKKLLKAIKDLTKGQEDRALERDDLKEELTMKKHDVLADTLAWLETQATDAAMQQLDEGTFLADVDLADDPVRKLVESRTTGEQYIDALTAMFKVQESQLPRGIRKYRLGEGNSKVINVPCVGWLPHGGAPRAVDERALDRFCEMWNQRQALAGEPVRIRWSPSQEYVAKVGFHAELS